ncbi:uncharacterized protein LOC141843983 [Curcuma longa]|uniref:uncharacterized protein LOC141843983 n=1 Tax=Curcuma longa TaxID=136217 RepID=UPI003D9F50C8
MTSENNFVQAAILRFDGHYDHWSMLMENFLRSKEYWQVVESGVAEPATGEILTSAQRAELDALKLKDLKAKNYFFQAIDRATLETILSKETSKDIWDCMKKKYQGNAKAKRMQLQGLRTEFETLRMKSGESVSDFFARIMTIANKMRIYGEKMKDVTIVEKILRSITPKFNFIVCSIEESKDIDELTINELQSSLLVHEQKLNQQDKEEQALKSECRTNLNKQYEERSNFVEKEEEVSLLMVCHVNEETQQNMWYLDTGCSNHMCGDKTTFSELDESFRNTVKFGDNSTVSVMGKGMIRRGSSLMTREKNVYFLGLKLVQNLEGRKVDNTLYNQIVGSLMYLTATRPDIMYVVSLISRYMECPKEIHLQVAKRIFRYLKGTIEYGLFYKKNEKSDLIGFTNCDYAGDLDDRKSTFGYVFMMSSAAIL